MATTSKAQLHSLIKGSNPGPDKRRRDGYMTAMSHLLDTAQTQTPSPIGTTTSGSGVVNLQLVQPANTILEDIVVLCTTAASLAQVDDTAAGDVGFKAGTTEGGTDIMAGVGNAITGSGNAVKVGQGSSIHAKVQTSLEGDGALTLAAGSGYTSTERTVHCQVSCSIDTRFDTDTGAFRVIGKYYNLL